MVYFCKGAQRECRNDRISDIRPIWFEFLVTNACPAVISVTTTSGVLRRTILVTLNTVGSSRASSFTTSLGKTRANGCLSSLSKEKSSDKCNNGNLHDSCVDADIRLHCDILRIYTFLKCNIIVTSVNDFNLKAGRIYLGMFQLVKLAINAREKRIGNTMIHDHVSGFSRSIGTT